MRITAIDHVGIAVADLDTAIAFYEKSYGMRCVHVEVNEEPGVSEAQLAVGESWSFIQLLSPLSPNKTIGKFRAQSSSGIKQISYLVQDQHDAHPHISRA